MMKDALGSIFEVPVSAAGGKSKIEIHSNRQIVLEGCKGVVDYSPDNVILSCAKGTITLLGNDFEIDSYLDDTIVIHGHLLSIEFTM